MTAVDPAADERPIDVSVIVVQPSASLSASLAQQTLHAHEVVASLVQARGAWVLLADARQPIERHALKNLLLAGEQLDVDLVVGGVRAVPHAVPVEASDLATMLGDAALAADRVLVRGAWLAEQPTLRTALAEGGDGLVIDDLPAGARIAAIPEPVAVPAAQRAVVTPGGGRLARDLPALAFVLARLLPTRREVVFDVRGARATDTVLRDLCEAWQQERPRVRHHWIAGEQRDTWRHAWHLGRARWLVCDEAFLTRLPKRRGQRMLVAGIALPLLRSGRDNPDWVLQPTSERRPAWSQVGRWDLAVAPSPFAEQVLRSSTAYVGQVVTGTVFGDAVAAAASDSGLRQRLGIDESERVVLVALASARSAPDLRGLVAALPGSVRAVAVTDDGSRLPEVPGIVQVDAGIAQWCAAADLMVTDWSALALEFARLRRPIIGLHVDGDALVRHRGTYVDLHACLPGPIVVSSDELASVLTSWVQGEPIAHHEERSAQFAQLAGPADGKTSARLWHALAGGR